MANEIYSSPEIHITDKVMQSLLDRLRDNPASLVPSGLSSTRGVDKLTLLGRDLDLKYTGKPQGESHLFPPSKRAPILTIRGASG